MDIVVVREFFLWCTILNTGLLAFSFLICAFGGDWVYRIHGRWYPMSRESFNVVLYSFMGLYKIFILMFNFVPYLALLLIG